MTDGYTYFLLWSNGPDYDKDINILDFLIDSDINYIQAMRIITLYEPTNNANISGDLTIMCMIDNSRKFECMPDAIAVDP